MKGKGRATAGAGESGLGGILRGLGGFLDVISNLSEQGGEFTRNGELGDDKKGIKAVYGLSVRLGEGGKPSLERFGNVKDRGRGPVVEEVREPLVDVFDEADHLLVVVELPGIDAKGIHYEINSDMLDLSAGRGNRKYKKEILLPCKVADEGAVLSYRNGVLELKLCKAK